MVSELGSEESPCSQLGVPDSHVVPLLAIHTVPAASISRPNNSPGRWPYPHCTDVDTEAQRGDLPALKTHSWEMTSSQVFAAASPVRLCPDWLCDPGQAFPSVGPGFSLGLNKRGWPDPTS